MSRTIVACPLEGPELEAIKNWVRRGPTTTGAIDFVHVVEQKTYVSEMAAWEYPSREQFQALHESAVGILRRELLPCLPESSRERVTFMVILDHDPAEALRRLAREQKADLLVIATRGLHGVQSLLHASFATKMVRTAPCDVQVIRSHGT